MKPTLRIDGLANVRDLGGLDRTDGTVTPSGVFIRSERLERVDSEGWQALHAHGVRTVIDLRRPDESTGQVPPAIKHIHVDLDGSDETDFWKQYEEDGRWGTPLYYLAHLQALPDRLALVLNAIADADDGAILFHCSAGWDRTGLVAAVLLRAVDVTDDAAVADYLKSFTNADAMAALHERSLRSKNDSKSLADSATPQNPRSATFTGTWISKPGLANRASRLKHELPSRRGGERLPHYARFDLRVCRK